MSDNSRFQKLLSPGKIGKMTLRNRLIMPAMAGMAATVDGFPTDSTKGYYEERAKGGVGMIIVGSCTVDFPLGISGKLRLSIDNDKFIPALAKVVDAIHKHGAKAALQLQHAGPAAIESIIGMQAVAASPVMRPIDTMYRIYSPPREITVAEMAQKVVLFAKAAQRAQKAGFDAIEIHAGHRYLINSFLSPFYNRRTDQYGGSFENRTRFLLEVVTAVREAVGKDFPMWCRINGLETDVQGITPDLGARHAELLDKAGLVDSINVSQWDTDPIGPPGFAIHLAEPVKKVVSYPVIAVGHLTPDLGESVLREGKADFIAMGRELIADPDLPNKLIAGDVEGIRPCLCCNNCIGTSECSVNAAHLKEKEYELKPAAKAKNVMVVGGGPGGMEAARILALRGHKVTLYDKEKKLGGALSLAAILREDDEPLIKYLAREVNRLGVNVQLGKKVTPELVAQIKPDAIVLATGATSGPSDIPGIDRDNVLTASDIQAMMSGHLRRAGAKGSVSPRRVLWLAGITAAKSFGPSFMRRLMRIYTPFGKRIVVVSMKLHGVEIGYFMAERGKKVTIVDSRDVIPDRILARTAEGGGDLPMPVLRQHYINMLTDLGAKMMIGVKYKAITAKGLEIINKEGKPETLEADTIVFAANYKPNQELYQQLKGKAAEVHLVGDCNEPVGILEAIRDGSKIGRMI